MKRIFFMFVLGWCVLQFPSLYAQKKTLVSATVTGYNGKVVDFEFVGQERCNMQFQYQDGQNMEFEAELNDVVILKVNAWIWIFLRPGDQIHANIQYDKRNYNE